MQYSVEVNILIGSFTIEFQVVIFFSQNHIKETLHVSKTHFKYFYCSPDLPFISKCCFKWCIVLMAITACSCSALPQCGQDVVIVEVLEKICWSSAKIRIVIRLGQCSGKRHHKYQLCQYFRWNLIIGKTDIICL